MDIQEQYLDIELCDKHFIYSIEISKYSAVISQIFIVTLFRDMFVFMSLFFIMSQNYIR